MRVIVVVATSLDGFITNGSDPYPFSWTSDADKAHYQKLKLRHKLHIFGKNTFHAKNKHPGTGILTVILTRNPEKFSDYAVDNILEFINLTPAEVIDKYKNSYESCLILGGSYVYTSFLQAGLVDEIYQTVEPVTHGSGIQFIGGGNSLGDIVELPSPEITDLNDSGTILKHYVLKK